MWFRNRLVNPLVRLLLRSPLHRLLSRSLVILSYQGRKTGRSHSLPCMYARDRQDLYIISGQPDRKVWWLPNLPANRPFVKGPNDPDRSLLVG